MHARRGGGHRGEGVHASGGGGALGLGCMLGGEGVHAGRGGGRWHAIPIF